MRARARSVLMLAECGVGRPETVVFVGGVPGMAALSTAAAWPRWAYSWAAHWILASMFAVAREGVISCWEGRPRRCISRGALTCRHRRRNRRESARCW